MKKEIFIAGGTAAIVILLLVLCLNHKKVVSSNFLLKKKIKELEEDKKLLQEDKLRIFHEYTKIAKEIPSEIVAQIEKLISDYQDIDEAIAKELIQVLELIREKKETKAIAALTKIIENLLKDQFGDKMIAEKKKKNITLYNLITFAKTKEFFTDLEYSLLQQLRKLRNKESHELAVTLSKNDRTMAFVTGIEIIFKLSGMKKA